MNSKVALLLSGSFLYPGARADTAAGFPAWSPLCHLRPQVLERLDPLGPRVQVAEVLGAAPRDPVRMKSLSASTRTPAASTSKACKYCYCGVGFVHRGPPRLGPSAPHTCHSAR